MARAAWANFRLVGEGSCFFSFPLLTTTLPCHITNVTGFFEGFAFARWCSRLYWYNLKLKFVLTSVVVELVVISVLATFFPLVQSSSVSMTWNSHWWSLFFLTEMIWFCLYASWITVNDIKSRSQEKQSKVILKLQFALISRNKLFTYQALYFTLSLYTIFLLPLSLSLFFEKSYYVNISRWYHASWKTNFAGNQQKFDSRTTSALYMLNDQTRIQG